MQVGRPSDYNDEIANLICERLAEGESLRTICADDSMPAKASVFRWLVAHKEFRDHYALAREAQADALADEIIDISDDGSNDWMEKHNAEGEKTGWTLNGEHVNRSRLRVDARKWVAAKLKPRSYGDRETAPPTTELTELLSQLIAKLPS